MKLKIMTTEAISYVKENIDMLTNFYKDGADPEKWIKEKIGKSAFVEISDLEFEDFNLIITSDKPSSTDIENIKILYTGLKDLNDSFATDERLWAGLSHTLFYDYLLKRWPDKYSSKDILNHFFFEGSKPRCFMVNTLARLWWLGRKTYVEGSDNNFEVLDYIAHDINGYAFTLFGSNWSNSERSRKLFFESIFKYENDTNETVGRNLFNDVMQYMNGICGIYAIDACDDEFIKNKIYDYIKERNQYLKEQKESNREENVKSTGIDKLDNIVKALNNIGGFGTYKELLLSLEKVYGSELTQAQIDYMNTSLNSYCPDARDYNGKPLFHLMYENGIKKFKISIDHLYNSNIETINEFTNKQIENQTDDESIVFNIITTIKNAKFSVNDILVYKTQLVNLHPEIKEIDLFIIKTLESIKTKGIIEKLDKNVYRKAYNLKGGN